MFVRCLIITIALCTGHSRGVSDIVLSEINSNSATLDNQNVFIELNYLDIDRFLMLRNPITRSGPSLLDHYILVVKPFDNEFGGPIVSTLIDLNKSAFKFDSNFFTIGTHKITADMYFEDSQMVYSIQNSARSEQCEEFLDNGDMYPVAVFLLVTKDKKFVEERLELNPRRPYVFVTDDIKDFINNTVADAVVYGRSAEFDRCGIFDEMIDTFKNADRYVLRQFNFPGFVDKSMSKCPSEEGTISLHQTFASHLFKLGKPTPGCRNDCSEKTFFLEDVLPKIVGHSGLVEADSQTKQTKYCTGKLRASIDSNVASTNIVALREELFPNDNEDEGGPSAKRPCIELLAPSECLMQHARHNVNPTPCGQQGTESANLQKLSVLNTVPDPNEIDYGEFKTLAEAILARADGLFHAKDHDLENILVCAKHVQEFYRDWNINLPSTKRVGLRVLTCKFPSILSAPSPHGSTTLARTNTFVSKEESEALLKLKNVFIPAGWPHKEFLTRVLGEYNAAEQRKNEEKRRMQTYFFRPRADTVCKVSPGSQKTDTSGGGSQRKDDSGSEYVPSQEKMDIDVPVKSTSEREIEEIQSAVRQLATAAKIPKVRFTNDLSTCKSSTFEEYAQIGRRLCNAISFAIAPFQSGELSKRVVADPKKVSEAGKDIEKLQSLMQAIADSYNEAKSPAMRNMILSLLAPYTQYNVLAELIPTMSPHKFTAARLYSKMYGPGTQPTEITRERFPIKMKPKLVSFIDFLLSNGVSVELPYGEVRVKLSSGETETIPNLLRVMNDEFTVDLYNTTLKEIKEKDPELWKKLELSRSSLLRILKTLKSSHRQQIRGLDYFHAYGSEGFESLASIVMKLEENSLVEKDWSTSIKKRLHDLHLFMKAEYGSRIRETSQVVDFCSTFALSDPDVDVFATTLTSGPKIKCSECNLLIDTIDDIAETVDEANYANPREKAEAKYLVGIAKQDILNWRAHIVRTFRQNLGRQRLMENLRSHQTIIWIDWAMKWLPERAREDQPSFFGKAGIPWHVSVAYKRNTDSSGYDVRYFVHSFQSTVQDSAAVVGIINDTLTRIKAECSYITEAIIFSDNAGCYKAGNTIATMPRMKQDTGIAVVRWDFSDPQSGKGPADRFAATAKRKARIYLAEGNNCETANNFVSCISSHDGTEGMTAIVSELDCRDNIDKPSKIKDITKLHNFQFHDNHLLVRRAYEIGRGRTVPLATLNPSYLQCQLKPIRVVNRGREQSAPLTNDTYWKSLVQASSTESTEAEQQLDEGDDASEISETDIEKLKDTAGLFGCPIPGCTKVFQRYKNLQRHLELGNHQFKPEKETLRDFVIREYKDRVERLQLNRFEEMRRAITEVGSQLTCPQNLVSDMWQGWALRTRKVERYSTTVRAYIDAKFDEGIKDPRRGKWKPDALAKEMRKDEQFDAKDFLSPQQIAAYFSRLAKQRETQAATQPEELSTEVDGEQDEERSDGPSEFEDDPSRDTTDEAINEVETELNIN